MADSLAGEHLQELEGLVSHERQKQEEVIKTAMGSIYSGEALCSRITRHLRDFPSASADSVLSDSYACFRLTDPDNRDCIGNVFPLSGPSSFPADANTSAGRN